MFDPAEVLPSSGGGGGGGEGEGGGTGGGTGGGGTGGGGTGGGGTDPSGGTDSSGNNTADNSQNILILDNSLNAWFFDAPAAATDGDMQLSTTFATPRLISTWTNPTQRRAAFDFVGNIPPGVDNSGVGIETVDDYNYLPYHQGIKAQLILYDQAGGVLGSGQSWTDITFNSSTTYLGLPGGRTSTFWETVDFLPRHLQAITIFNSTTTSNEYNFNTNTLAYSLPATWGTGNTPTAGAKVRIRLAMVNRAQVTITDPSYVEHNATSDVSWNWIYLPGTGGLAIGDYGDPTPPLSITIPTSSNLQYKQFSLSGANDNSGNNIILATANRNQAIVEIELGTRFENLNKNNTSLPKVQYRYDLSGSRAPSSKQVGGSQAGVGGTNWLDISINIPNCTPADNSLNWIPSNFAGNTLNAEPNMWTSTLTSSTHPLIVFPEHNYKLTRYSMRYSLDSSRNNADGYTDASLNTAQDAFGNALWSSFNLWTTLRPKRSECTTTYASGLPDSEITGNFSRSSGTWPTPISQYLIDDGALKAWETVNTIAVCENLLFLNADTVAQYISTAGYSKSIRANGIVSSTGNETFVGTETVNQDIIRMNSEVKLDGGGNWFAGWDLSGVQRGFGAPSVGTGATNPTNNYLEWQTTAITNAYEITNDISRNGGYYCGTRLSDVKLKNINLTDYQDVSNNTSQKGYKVTLYQELKPSAAGNWSRYPLSTGGQYKLFKPATRPTQDLTFNADATATFVINDGFDGAALSSYNNSNNNFKFGSDALGQNPTPNFFGLPLIYPSQDVISYSLTFSQFDLTWWPTDGNAVDLFRFYIRSGNQGAVLPSAGYDGSTYEPGYHSSKPTGKYIQWGGDTRTKKYPWDEASQITGSFPDLPSNGVSSLTGDFDFNNGGSSSFTSNKYSRDLFDHNTYSLATPNTTNPFFYVDACYDNNILRANRGKSGVFAPNLEAGNKRTIGEAYSSAGNLTYKNRFEGKGVGPDGKYLLFWDSTLNTSVTFQKVGDINSSSTEGFTHYPFVDEGGTNDYTAAFDHSDKLSNGTTASNGGDRQLIWAKNGFKPGGQTTTSTTNPYIDYSGNYWFGNHTGVGFTQDYRNLNNVGETMHPANVNYTATSSGGNFSWWSDTTTSIRASFNWDTSLRFKFIVLKVPFKTGNIPSGGFRGFELSLKKLSICDCVNDTSLYPMYVELSSARWSL